MSADWTPGFQLIPRGRYALALLVILSGLLRAGETNDEQLLQAADDAIPQVRQRGATIRVLDAGGKPVMGVRVRIDQVSHQFLFGALSDTLFSGKLSAPEATQFRQLFGEVFNFTIAKVYWTAFEPTRGHPAYAELDAFLAWAHGAHLTVKGHPLAWTHPAGTPNWLLALPDEEATRLLDERIRTLVSRYRGSIDFWDVVNEPVTTVPWPIAMQDPVNTSEEIASGKRYDVTGITIPDIIPSVERAFRVAAAANPRAALILNEFFLIAKPEVRARFIRLVRELQARGVPLTGLGIQAHEPRDQWFTPAQIKAALDDLAQLGLPLHITEFIPQSSGKPVIGGPGGTWTPEAQARFAEQLYTMAFSHPAVASINWWGFSDRDTWLEGGGLVDEKLQPKPAYITLHRLIREKWQTHGLELTTDAAGEVHFRGFLGTYQVGTSGVGRKTSTHDNLLHAGPETLWTIRVD
jgi:GH35 family endo-1,4-beta-xylanase